MLSLSPSYTRRVEPNSSEIDQNPPQTPKCAVKLFTAIRASLKARPARRCTHQSTHWCWMPSLASEEQRLRERAERAPADPHAIAAFGRFLKHKMGLPEEGERWQRRAVEAVAQRLSPTLTPMEAYFL